MSTISTLVVNMRANTGQFEKGVKRSGKSLDTFKKKASSVSASFVKGMAAMVAATLAVRKVIQGINTSINEMDNMGKASDTLGMSTEALIGLKYAAESNNNSFEQLQASIRDMTKNLAEARTGSGATADALKSLGLNANELVKMGVEESFLTISDSISKIPGQFDKAAIAIKIFGESGSNMLNVINLGRDGLKKQREEAEKLGISFSRIDAENMANVNKGFLDLQMVIDGIYQQISEVLGPYLIIILEDFINLGLAGTKFFSDMTEGMSPLMEMMIFFHKISSLIQTVWQGIAYFFAIPVYTALWAIKKIIDGIAWSIEKIGNFMGIDGAGDYIKSFNTEDKGLGFSNNNLLEALEDTMRGADKKSIDLVKERVSNDYEKNLKKRLLKIRKDSEERVKKIISDRDALSNFSSPSPSSSSKVNAKATAMELKHQFIDVAGLRGTTKETQETKVLKQLLEATKKVEQNTKKTSLEIE